jgi:agmatine/peptidylarginine deiminase
MKTLCTIFLVLSNAMLLHAQDQNKVEDEIIRNFREFHDSPISNENSYRIFQRPTAPPNLKVTPIDEYDSAGYLVVVWYPSYPVIEIIKAAVEHTPIILVAGRDETTAETVIEDILKKLDDAGLKKYLASGEIQIAPYSVDTPWIRDYGPMYVSAGQGKSKQAFALDAVYEPKRYLDEELKRMVERYYGKLDRRSDESLPYHLCGELKIPTFRPPLVLSGGNFTTNKNVCFTSTETIVENGGNQFHVDILFKRYFGCKKVVYLEPLPGPTTKHIDMFFRVADKKTYLLANYEPKTNPSTAGDFFQNEAHLRMERNMKLLKADSINIVRVDMPQIIKYQDEKKISLRFENYGDTEDKADEYSNSSLGSMKTSEDEKGTIVYRSLLNYLHLRGKTDLLLVPFYREERLMMKTYKESFERIMKQIYPGVQIKFIDSDRLIEGQGAIHCITNVIPRSAVRQDLRFKVDIEKRKQIEGDDSTIIRFNDGSKYSYQRALLEYRYLVKAYFKDTIDYASEFLWKWAVENVADRIAVDKIFVKLNQKLDMTDFRPAVLKRTQEFSSDPQWGEYFKEIEYYERKRDAILKAIGEQTEPTPEEINDYYTDHESDYIVSGELKGWVVSYYAKDNTVEWNELYDEHDVLKQLATKISCGVDFKTQLLQQFQSKTLSIDSISFAEGGLDASLEEYFYDINKLGNEDVTEYTVSSVWNKELQEEQLGYMFFKICEITPYTVKPLEQVTAEIKEILIEETQYGILEKQKANLGMTIYPLNTKDLFVKEFENLFAQD